MVSKTLLWYSQALSFHWKPRHGYNYEKTTRHRPTVIFISFSIVNSGSSSYFGKRSKDIRTFLAFCSPYTEKFNKVLIKIKRSFGAVMRKLAWGKLPIPPKKKQKKTCNIRDFWLSDTMYWSRNVTTYNVRKQEHSYRQQIARQLRTQYAEGIYRHKYYTVTLKSHSKSLETEALDRSYST